MSAGRTFDYPSVRYTAVDSSTTTAFALSSTRREALLHLLASIGKLLTNLSFLRGIQLIFAAWPILTYLFLAIWESIDDPMKQDNPGPADGAEYLRKTLSGAVMVKVDRNNAQYPRQPEFLGPRFVLGLIEVLYCGYLLSSRVFFPPRKCEKNKFGLVLPESHPRARAEVSGEKVHLRKTIAIVFFDLFFSFLKPPTIHRRNILSLPYLWQRATGLWSCDVHWRREV